MWLQQWVKSVFARPNLDTNTDKILAAEVPFRHAILPNYLCGERLEISSTDDAQAENRTCNDMKAKHKKSAPYMHATKRTQLGVSQEGESYNREPRFQPAWHTQPVSWQVPCPHSSATHVMAVTGGSFNPLS